MTLSPLNWLLAFSPILVILILMLGFHWSGSRAGAASWLAAVVVALAFFGANLDLLIVSQAKSVLLTLDVLYIIWMALLFFHVSNEAGAISVIGGALSRLTGDKTMQGLLVGWVFASFLQGVGGFGVPVAITAPLLVGLGFNPIQAVVMASIGTGWSVSFGSMGTSFMVTSALTGLPPEMLAPDAALLLGLSAIPCGAMVAFVAGGWRGLRHTLPAVIILGAVMGTVQYLIAVNGVWVLGAVGGGMAGLLAGVALTRLPLYRNHDEKPAKSDTPACRQSLWVAVSGYLILILLAFTVNLIPEVKLIMNQATLSIQFPQVMTSTGWETPAELGRQISIFVHPGAILLYTSLAAFLVYSIAGCYQAGAPRKIFKGMTGGAVKSSLGIVTMVAMATIMFHTGMTNLLALGLSEGVGPALYPLVSPFIGALGAFITGSNNNSNVLFAVLQQNTAELLGLSVTMILAAQTTGGALGSIMAPAKVIVGCSTVGLSGKEGKVIREMLVYGLLLIVFSAIITLLLIQIA